MQFSCESKNKTNILYVLFFFKFAISVRLAIGISTYLLCSFTRARKGANQTPGRKGKIVIKQQMKKRNKRIGRHGVQQTLINHSPLILCYISFRFFILHKEWKVWCKPVASSLQLLKNSQAFKKSLLP